MKQNIMPGASQARAQWIAERLHSLYEQAREQYFNEANRLVAQNPYTPSETLVTLWKPVEMYRFRQELAGWDDNIPPEARIIESVTHRIVFESSYYTCQRILKRLSSGYILIWVGW